MEFGTVDLLFCHCHPCMGGRPLCGCSAARGGHRLGFAEGPALAFRNFDCVADDAYSLVPSNHVGDFRVDH